MARVKDLAGQRFGSLVVLERSEGSQNGKALWRCRCDCGAEKVVAGADLRSGRTKSCGGGVHKIGMNVENLIGRRFGRLVVLDRGKNSRNGSVKWVCKCDCGAIKEIHRSALKTGATISCGCWQKDNPSYFKHRLSKTRVYGIWCGMKDRCYNPNTPCYERYGGRGITICDEWVNSPEAFIKWAYENGYGDDLSIDRIDVNGNYEPSNCRWATVETQANNKRNTIRLAYNGETHTISEWSKITGLPRELIYGRVHTNGFSVAKALGYECPITKKNADTRD